MAHSIQHTVLLSKGMAVKGTSEAGGVSYITYPVTRSFYFYISPSQ